MVVVVDSLLLSSTSEAVPRRRSKLRANSVSAQSVPVQMCASPGADVAQSVWRTCSLVSPDRTPMQNIASAQRKV